MASALKVLIYAFYIFNFNIILAQDIIKKNDGEILQVKILATSKTEITFIIQTSEKKDSVASIDKHLCYSIQKQGQSEEVLFEKVKVLPKIITQEDSLKACYEGKDDAKQYYQKYKRPGTLVLLTSLFSPIIGLIPAVISTSTRVKEENKFYPDLIGTKINPYYKAYSKEAKRIKVKVVWRNWTFGFLTNVVVISILANKYR